MQRSEARITAEELVGKYLDGIYRYAYRLCGSVEDAEDLTQETFLIAAQKVDQLRDPERALAWLVKIVRSCWARLGRKSLPLSPVPVEQIEAAVPGEAEALGSVEPAEVLSVLNSLPDEYRDPLLLFYFEELKYREIGDVLGVPVGTVMSRIARGKAFLRECLAAKQEPVALGSEPNPSRKRH